MARRPQRTQQPSRDRRADDEVTEAGIESFPASDPPAYNMPGRNRSRAADAARTEAAVPAPTAEPVWGRATLLAAIAVVVALAVAAWFAFA